MWHPARHDSLSGSPLDGGGSTCEGRFMHRIRVVVATSVAAVVALSAGVALAKPLSEKQWKQRANAVCKQTNKQLDKIGNEVFAGLGRDEEPSPEQTAAFAQQFVPVINDAIASIDALDEPKSLKSDVRKFKAAARAAVAAVEADPTSAFTGQRDPFAKVDKIAKKLGPKECANG